MKKESAAIGPPAKEAAPMKLLPASNLLDRLEDMSNSIARRAFEIFERRGGTLGLELQDWLRAESELLHPVHLDIAQSDYAYTVHLEVPGFTAKDLEVGVEPHRLTVSGTREISQERAGKETVYKEHCVNQIFRTIDLPAEVDSSQVTATLRDGVLELSMPKAAKPQKVRVEEKPT
jgi:HSP20 family molecular chaperone IbpA